MSLFRPYAAPTPRFEEVSIRHGSSSVQPSLNPMHSERYAVAPRRARTCMPPESPRLIEPPRGFPLHAPVPLLHQSSHDGEEGDHRLLHRPQEM